MLIMTETVEIADVYIDDEGICHWNMTDNENLHWGKKQAYEIIKAAHEVCEGRPTPILVDGRGVKGSMDHEARFVMRNSEKMLQIRKAVAYLVDSKANKAKALFYILFNRPPNPVKIFFDEQKALEWLREFL